jgi:glyoxylase-like metal-dependent hydrolase (beta-lactamase superfamily II)
MVTSIDNYHAVLHNQYYIYIWETECIMNIWVVQGMCNCIVLAEREGCSAVVVDPGAKPDDILSLIRAKSLSVDKILLTHGHYDHIEAVEDLARETNASVMIHPADRGFLNNRLLNLRPAPRGNDGAALPYHTEDLEDNMTISSGGLSFKVLHTPGHTQGSCCFQCDDVLLTGDTLFAGDCGRWDLPGGDYDMLCASLGRLAAMEESFEIYPGHGETTTTGHEKLYNPYFKA